MIVIHTAALLLPTIGVYMRVSTPFLRSFKFSCLSFHTTRSLYLANKETRKHYRRKNSKPNTKIHFSAEKKNGTPQFNAFNWHKEAAGKVIVNIKSFHEIVQCSLIIPDSGQAAV